MKGWILKSVLLLLALAGAGCHTTYSVSNLRDAEPYREVRLREGDTIKIAFPGAKDLDAVQQVRRDGKITVPVGGAEVVAAGKTTAELETNILAAVGGELTVKQVVVTVNSSSYPVFVTGAVLKPGKYSAERPISALEAVMEAGGFDYAKANLKSVVVMRQAEGRVINHKINIYEALKGPKSNPFYLRPFDIVYVPEKFSWF